jgi:hypothetical protein
VFVIASGMTLFLPVTPLTQTLSASPCGMGVICTALPKNNQT